ncbi:hypothetical protein BHE74_00058815, partial [Ensete ventricosum]
ALLPSSGRASPLYGLATSCWRYSCGLVAGKHHTLQVGYGRALPLWPTRGRASPLVGWPWATAPAGALVAEGPAVGYPLSSQPLLRKRRTNA